MSLRSQLRNSSVLLALSFLNITATYASPVKHRATAPVAVVDHNYKDVEGDVYYYEAAISDDEASSGQAATRLLGFKHTSCKDDGRVCVVMVDGRGYPINAASCALPCRIVRFGTGETIAYSSGSIVGAALEDAINGKMALTTAYPGARTSTQQKDGSP